MNRDDFIELAQRLTTETLKLSSSYKINDFLVMQALIEHSYNFKRDNTLYDTDARRIAYALRYGIKTAFQTWKNLRFAGEFEDIQKLLLLGGGCAFELPVILKHLALPGKIQVQILDLNTDWGMFKTIHSIFAESMGFNLDIKWVKSVSFAQIKEFGPDLIFVSNMLGEISHGQRLELRENIQDIPNYCVQQVRCNNANTWELVNQVTSKDWTNKSDDEAFPTEEMNSFIRKRNEVLYLQKIYNNLDGVTYCQIRNNSQRRDTLATARPLRYKY